MDEPVSHSTPLSLLTNNHIQPLKHGLQRKWFTMVHHSWSRPRPANTMPLIIPLLSNRKKHGILTTIANKPTTPQTRPTQPTFWLSYIPVVLNASPVGCASQSLHPTEITDGFPWKNGTCHRQIISWATIDWSLTPHRDPMHHQPANHYHQSTNDQPITSHPVSAAFIRSMAINFTARWALVEETSLALCGLSSPGNCWPNSSQETKNQRMTSFQWWKQVVFIYGW